MPGLQLMPEGLLVTMPPGAPPLDIVIGKPTVAVTVFVVFIVTLQLPKFKKDDDGVVELQPLQPEK